MTIASNTLIKKELVILFKLKKFHFEAKIRKNRKK